MTEGHLPERAPSLVALAAAFEALDVGALHVAGVREWVERMSAGNHELEDDEAVRLWAFVEQTREAAGRVRDDADRLAALLLGGFLADRARWPLTADQEREFHEVLATLAAREAEAHCGELGEQRASEGHGAVAPEGGD